MTAQVQQDAAQIRQFISFVVGEEEYGLELLRVNEVIRTREVTAVPRTPRFVRGIINLRGDVIPVIDLRERFGLPAAAHSEAARVIVTEVRGSRIGMAVDSANQVVRIPADQLQPAPAFVGDSVDFISAVGRLDERLVIMIDTDRLLDEKELGAVRAAVPAAAA